jgi:hypothetical protein
MEHEKGRPSIRPGLSLASGPMPCDPTMTEPARSCRKCRSVSAWPFFFCLFSFGAFLLSIDRHYGKCRCGAERSSCCRLGRPSPRSTTLLTTSSLWWSPPIVGVRTHLI